MGVQSDYFRRAMNVFTQIFQQEKWLIHLLLESFQEAVSVKDSPLNMTTKKFFSSVPSLVVKKEEGKYQAMSIEEW